MILTNVKTAIESNLSINNTEYKTILDAFDKIEKDYQYAIENLQLADEAKKQKFKIELKHPGAFKNWCDKHGLLSEDGEVTCECIEEALKTDDKILHKRAWFAYNFGFKRNGKTCTNVENLKNAKEDLKNLIDLTDEELETGKESFLDDMFSAVDNAMYKGLKGIVDIISTTSIVVNGVKEYSTKSSSIKNLARHKIAVERILNNDIDYEKLYEIQAPVMLGLSVTLNQLVEILDNLSRYPSIAYNKVKEFDNEIASIVPLPADRLEKAINFKREISEISSYIRDINDELKVISKDKILTDRKKIKNLISKLNKLPELIVKTIQLGKIYRTEIIEDLNAIMEDSVDNVKSLVENISDYNVSSRKLVELANYVKVVGELVTSTAFIFYIYNQTVDMEVALCKIVEGEDNSKILGWFKDTAKKVSERIQAIFN